MFRDQVFRRMRSVARSECVLCMGEVLLCCSSLCYQFMNRISEPRITNAPGLKEQHKLTKRKILRNWPIQTQDSNFKVLAKNITACFRKEISTCSM